MTSAITDFTQYTGLRAAAENRDPAVLREVAGQFEALFLQTMLKNMREASLAEPIFGNSDQHEMYQEMMDQQLAVEMASGKGIGLADMLVRQLGGDLQGVQTPHRSVQYSQTSPVDAPASHTMDVKRGDVPESGSPTNKPFWNDAVEFAKDVWPHVKRVAKVLNVSPVGILAQTALETGWGKHVMQNAKGGNSYNLFGVKASGGWAGDATSKPTIEFQNGVAQRQTEKFRAYDDVAATFHDYENLLAQNPRYASVSDHGNNTRGFAEALQASGYATDPAYAEKLSRVADSPMMQKILERLKNGDSQSITNRLEANRQMAVD